MKILDLFCGAGGASMGLHYSFHNAEITGVDIVPQKRYPFQFVQADALDFPLDGYDFIWASPPCQAHSRLKAINKKEYQDFIELVRMRFKNELSPDVPTVIENVIGAPLVNPVMLCGSMFDLGVWRHRIFECSFPISQRKCRHERVPLPIDVTGTGGPCLKRTTPGGGIHRKPRNMDEASQAMGINWMTRKEITQAIPPEYAQRIALEYKIYSGNFSGETRQGRLKL